MADLSKNPEPGDFDPYRFGAPPAPVSAQTRPTGKQILTASWGLLKQDRELIAVPLLGTIASFVAFAIFFAPGLIIGLASGNHGAVFYIFAIVGGFAASVVGIFFQTALVIGAFQRADGQTPTFDSVMRGAWQLRSQILQWAVVTTIVGTIVRAVEQRLGIVGKLLGFLGGIAWAVATFFVLPVIVAEGLGPIDAVKRSAATIRQIWGTSVRTTLRFGLMQVLLLLAPILVIIAGIAVASSGGVAAAGGGVVLIGIGVLALIGLFIVLGAIATYARAVLYRWATGRPVPGIDPALFAGAFRPRRRRGRR